MDAQTANIIKKLADLGKQMDFEVSTEVSKGFLALQFKGAPQFVPRIDLVWSMNLESNQKKALKVVTGHYEWEIEALPIVGIEVEGTDPTTKTLECDVANINVLGTPLGLLVSNYNPEKNVTDTYRRASRVLRSMQLLHGNMDVLPLDSCWLPDLSKGLCGEIPDATPLIEGKKTSGGENKWSLDARERLRAMGKKAGFEVAEEWTPPIINNAFRAIADGTECTWDPNTHEPKPVKKAGDFLTASRIDLVWFIKLPPRLRRFIECICEEDPDIERFLTINPADWGRLPVVGFEFETSGGKHAGGGLLNLGAHTVIGVCAVPNEQVSKRMEMKLETFSRTLGLRNVYVREEPWKI